MDNGESSYRRFIEGDQSAFDELMDAYRDRLIFFVKGYVGSAEEAQDIAMDTFVEILVHPGRFRFKSSFKTYIYSVARHKAIDFLRKKRTVPDEGARRGRGDLGRERDRLFLQGRGRENRARVHGQTERRLQNRAVSCLF